MCMKDCKEDMLKLSKEFQECNKAFIAIGDETRQHIIIALLESDCSGIRVGEITKKTHLSRPAVSHHLKILKEAGIIGMRREGTKNYYYIKANGTEFGRLFNVFKHINEIIEDYSDKQNKDCYEDE